MAKKVVPPHKEVVRNRYIRSLRRRRYPVSQIAKHMGLSRQRIYVICQGVEPKDTIDNIK